MSWQGIELNKILALTCLLENKSWQFQTLYVVTRTDVARIFNSLLNPWVDSKYSLGLIFRFCKLYFEQCMFAISIKKSHP